MEKIRANCQYTNGKPIYFSGATSEKGLRLCESVLENHIQLVPLTAYPHVNVQDSTQHSGSSTNTTTNRSALMKSLPVIAPIFVAHFMTAAGEIYTLEPLASTHS